MAILFGEGTLLQVESSGGTPTWITVGELAEMEGPALERAVVEIADLASPLKRKRASRQLDMGQLTLTVNRDPADAGQARLKALIDDPPLPGAEPDFRVVFNGGNDAARPYLSFPGFVSALSVGGMTEEENVQDEITVTVTGEFAEGTVDLTE